MTQHIVAHINRRLRRLEAIANKCHIYSYLPNWEVIQPKLQEIERTDVGSD